MTHDQPPEATPQHPGASPDDEAARQEQQPPPLQPKIWVGSLSDYNSGRLYGIWLDANRPAADILDDIRTMLRRSPAARGGEIAEEWGIFDHEDFGGLNIGEYELIEDVSQIAHLVATYGPAYALWADDITRDDASEEAFQQSYQGTYPSAVAYAEQLVTDLGADEPLQQFGDWLRPHVTIDYQGLVTDLTAGGAIDVVHDPDGTVHIFSL